MAITTEGRQLTEAHRLAQAGVSSAAIRDLLTVWRLLDPADLNRTFPEYARMARIVIAAGRQKSAATAAAYLRAFRIAEGITVPLDVALAATLAEEAATTSLLVTGPIAFRVAERSGKPPERVAEIALSQTMGAVSRLIQNAGRETVFHTVMRDPRAVGYARVTDGNPCAFCALLASRGAVYKSEARADFKAHNRCGCHAEPVYARGDAYTLPNPENAARWAALYDEHAASADDKLAAFRKAYRAAQ